MMPSDQFMRGDGGGGNSGYGLEDIPSLGNPLLCFICKDYYSDPCLLSCYHTFCAKCLKGKAVDGKISCQICR